MVESIAKVLNELVQMLSITSQEDAYNIVSRGY